MVLWGQQKVFAAQDLSGLKAETELVADRLSVSLLAEREEDDLAGLSRQARNSM
jgi:hypothetical protein